MARFPAAVRINEHLKCAPQPVADRTFIAVENRFT